MKLLLDSHVLIWAVEQPSKLSVVATSALQDGSNEPLLSAATIWEVSIKVGIKKLSLSRPYRQWMSQAMADLGVTLLPITLGHADAQAGLPLHHRDPFDRMLVAQARVENVPLVSADPFFDPYGVPRIWS